MLVDTAKYIRPFADANPENFEVIDFSGCDVVSSPYWFDINIRIARPAGRRRFR